MKCAVCKINEARANFITCSDRCDKIRLEIRRLTNKHAPTHGCDNCLGDLHQGCSAECKIEFKNSHEFTKELYALVRVAFTVS